mmetsp:Transcript_23648/g.70361  ORF Transcript_23648/g.70361 Transcript_23648/m.70361 type:complete len:952 (-) Transcript_23648:122-2977(-)
MHGVHDAPKDCLAEMTKAVRAATDLELRLLGLQLLDVLDHLLLLHLEGVRLVILLVLHGRRLLLPQSSEVLLQDFNVVGELRLLGLVLGLLVLGRVGLLVLGVGLLVLLLLLRLLRLLQLIPSAMQRGQLLGDLIRKECGSLVERQRLLLGNLLLPPLLEVLHFLGGSLGLVGVHPGHVLSDDVLHVPNLLQTLSDLLVEVGPGLELNRSLPHGVEEALKAEQLGLVVALRVARLEHPLLEVSGELRHLLALRLRGHLDDVLALKLVTAAVDCGLEVILHASDSSDLRLYLGPGVQLLLLLGDLVLREGQGQEVFPLHRKLLLVFPLLLLPGDLLRLVLRGGGIVLGGSRRIGGGFLLAAHLRLVLSVRVGLIVGLRLIVGLCRVLLGLILGDVHPVQLLDGRGGNLDLDEAAVLQGDRRRDLHRPGGVVLLPLVLHELREPSEGVLVQKDPVLEQPDGEVLLELEGQLLLLTEDGPGRVQRGDVLLPAAVQGDHLHCILVLRDVGEEDLLHAEAAARVRGHQGCSEGTSLLAVEVIPEQQLLVVRGLNEVGQHLLDLRHAPGAADNLHMLDFRHGHVRSLERFADGDRERVKHVLAHFLELLALDRRLEVRVLVEGLHNEGRNLVGAEDGLRLLRLREQLPQGTRVLDDASCQLGVLLLELLEHGLCNLEVHQVTPKVAVDRRAQHCHNRRHPAGNHASGLALELHNRRLRLPGSHVEEEHQLGVALLRGEVDSPMHRVGGDLVHQGQHTQACDLACGNDRLALTQGGIRGHRHDEVADVDGGSLARSLGHLLGREEDARQDLLAIAGALGALSKDELGLTTLRLVIQIVLVELVAEAKLFPPLAANLDVLRGEVVAEKAVEEHGHLRGRLALVGKRIISEDAGGFHVGDRRGRFPLGVGIQDNLEGHALSHQGNLEELVTQVDTHDLCLGAMGHEPNQEPSNEAGQAGH